MHFLGIDPGSTGAIVLIDEAGKPVSMAKFDGADPLAVVRGFYSANNLGMDTPVAVEKVHSFPGQGVASSFNFGVTWGKLLGYFYALGTPVALYSPQEWQKWLPGGETGKDRVKRYVEGLGLVDAFIFDRCRVPHSGLMDSFAIANYHRRVVSGEVIRSGKAVKGPVKRSKAMKF